MSINPGDLVVCIKPAPCCGAPNGIGKIGTVGRMNRNPTYCRACLALTPPGTLVAELIEHRAFCEVHRLLRIDPLPESERTPTEEVVHA